MSKRDTQFANFARLLLAEFDSAIEEESTQIIARGYYGSEQAFANRLGTIIARRAYDLARHVAESIEEQESNAQYDHQHIHVEYMLPRVPDMAAWPVEGAQ